LVFFGDLVELFAELLTLPSIRLSEWQKQQVQEKKDKEDRINRKIQILSAPEPKKVHMPLDEGFVAETASVIERVGDSVSQGLEESKRSHDVQKRAHDEAKKAGEKAAKKLSYWLAFF